MFIILTAITAVLLKVILSINFGVSGIIWATIIGWSMFYVLPAYYVTLNYFKNKINPVADNRFKTGGGKGILNLNYFPFGRNRNWHNQTRKNGNQYNLFHLSSLLPHCLVNIKP